MRHCAVMDFFVRGWPEVVRRWLLSFVHPETRVLVRTYLPMCGDGVISCGDGRNCAAMV